MRRAERFLKLIQVLRRHRRPVIAEHLARELEVSQRTIYRDISALMADGVPIRGEAGVGYVLGAGYDLPPLMFTADEIEALLVGMSWVETRADVGLSRAARDVLAKVGTVLPPTLAPLMIERTVSAAAFGRRPEADRVDVAAIRKAIRDRQRITLDYIDEKGVRTARVVWPLAIGYFELARILVAWCEKRAQFRHFRTDRMVSAIIEPRRYPGSRAKLMRAWRDEMRDYACGGGDRGGPSVAR